MTRNGLRFESRKLMRPSWLMPKSMTMLRAISVARSRSFCAPVEMSLKIISSATRAAQQHLDAAFQLALRHQEAIVLGPLHRVAERGQAARNDRDLVDRIGVRQRRGDQRVARLVIGHAQLFVLLHDAAFLFEAGAGRARRASLKSAIVDELACPCGRPAGPLR